MKKNYWYIHIYPLIAILTIMLVAPGLAFSEGLIEQRVLKQNVIGEEIERNYWLYTPKNLPENPALVVVMHGYSGDALAIMSYSGMNDIADSNGFLVAYPQGTIDSEGNAFFNVGYEFHHNSAVDDVAFVEAVVNATVTEDGADAAKVFVTGMSNGGDMSYLLACSSSKVFRAVAPVAGSMMKTMIDQCAPDRTLPIMAISGTDDPVTLYAGDQQNSGGWGAYIGQEETRDFWVAKHGFINSSTVEINDSHKPIIVGNSKVQLQRYWNSRGKSEVWFYRVDNGGHDWPGAKFDSWWQPTRYAALYGMGFGKNKDIDSSEEIWKFFSHWITKDNDQAL
ncbi:MAG: alpha/beta hydrolase family esterase [Actinomycetota bacterium]